MHLRAIVAAIICLLWFASEGPVVAAEIRVPILVYHRFDPATPGAMTVTTSVFAEQLAWLAKHWRDPAACARGQPAQCPGAARASDRSARA